MYFLNDFEMVPVAPIITGITLVFTFHMRCISIVRSLYFKIFSASFLTTFLYYYYYYYYYYHHHHYYLQRPLSESLEYVSKYEAVLPHIRLVKCANPLCHIWIRNRHVLRMCSWDIDLARLTLLSPPFLHATKCNVWRVQNKLIYVKMEALGAKRMHSRSNGTAFKTVTLLVPQLVCYASCFHL